MRRPINRQSEIGNWQLLWLLLLPVLLAGCLQSTDELTLEPDGSGQIQIEFRTSAPPELLGEDGPMPGANRPTYPPLTEEQAKRFFPLSSFAVTVKESPGPQRSISIRATFTNLNALLASPYAKAHALSLEVTNGQLRLRAISGLEAAARLADIKETDGEVSERIPGFTELQQKSTEMRGEFRVKLPQPADGGNGVRNGRQVTWIEERARATNQSQFAERLGLVLETTCPAGNFPVPAGQPRRLAAARFAEVNPGPIESGSRDGVPDATKVLAAARFVPHLLQVTRSIDLVGERGAQESRAILSGSLQIPKELAPVKWGEAVIEEVVDAGGNNLQFPSSHNSSERFSAAGLGNSGDGTDEFAVGDNPEEVNANAGRASAPRPAERTFSMQFRAPEWQVKEIARVKASVRLHYGGGSLEVVTLTNAIPTKAVVDGSRSIEAMLDFNSSTRLASAALKKLGLNLEVQTVMPQPGYTLVMLSVEGKSASLTDAQIYDATGRPWPTALNQEDGGSSSAQIFVAGQPKGPLSIALVVATSGAGVTVPITLEKLPITVSP